MAIGTKSDFKIYNDQFYGGYIEQLAQVTDVFNAASNNALKLVPLNKKGELEYESFIKDIANVVSRRDPTSTSDATAKKVEQDEFISVKVNRKIGPVDQTLDAFKKLGRQGVSDQELSFLLGSQVAKSVAVDYVNTGLTSIVGALGDVSDLLYTVPSSANLTTDSLVKGLQKFGDRASRIVCWVMHSKPYYDLVSGQISDNITNIADFNVQTARAVTLNRPVIITDSTALKTNTGGSPDYDEYYTLGLTADAVNLLESEERTVVTELVTGKENLIVRLQGEYAFNIKLLGFKYDTTVGANPTTTALGTSGTWDKVLSDVKDLAGVRIKSR